MADDNALLALLARGTDTRALLGVAAVALIGLVLATPSEGVRRAVLVGCVMAGAWYLIASADARRTSGPAEDASLVDAGTTAARVMDAAEDAHAVLSGGATYQVRHVSAGAAAIALHTDVQRALADLLRQRDASSKGTLQTAVNAVDTFLRRYHSALMAPPNSFQARQDVPLLLDARREALNSLHALEFGVSHARVGPIRHAVGVVRSACSRAIRILGNKHPLALRGVVLGPPYPAIDPMADPHLVD